ncbi:hypothetical protein DFQ01_14713 [Paenibacillus cellulosilyticus]|uniref:Uncharacterized protein n=1 Tax=Paenibacillus cellulosilyticus TaxID=375489 RepID=A0A2V2YCA6_9BACL|nr:hypothetical protein [Paenibacillus cellulosilyticus]PWV89362.1 hypothetical protein DFQ01_14713 [Paenibacillus cellulosilyticus]QKS47315.1 hypothetical protein HUB94_23100 [Paenibacillus cellulosilyticus]
MEPIFPLQEDHISRFCGLPVCIVTHDGRRHVGVLSNCRSGRVTLNGPMGSPNAGQHANVNQYHSTAEIAETPKKQNKKNKKQAVQDESQKVQTQAYDGYGYDYGYYNPWGAAFAIDLAAIAFLFLLL